jgi:hypothetical protein
VTLGDVHRRHLSSHRCRALAAVAAPAALAWVAGCEFGNTTVPVGRERLVVHAVLNPRQSSQYVLVEQALTGRVTVDRHIPFDPDDPIATGDGIPVLSARVLVINLATGDTAVAFNEGANASDGHMRGVYRVTSGTNPPSTPSNPNPPKYFLPITRGVPYRLVVQSDSALVTGETTIPDALPGPTTPIAATLDADRDTLRLGWIPAIATHRYALEITTPFGGALLFTDSTYVRLSGELRNIFVNRLPRVFVPGFIQDVQLAAVDQNFYDYYRSANSPFTGSGIINRLTGGTGLFGGYVPIETWRIEVTAQDDQPVEGAYVPTSQGRIVGVDTLRLYAYDRTPTGLALSGYIVRRTGDGGDRTSLLGELDGAQVDFVPVHGVSQAPAGPTISGTFGGDSLVLADPTEPGRTVVYRKAVALRH